MLDPSERVLARFAEAETIATQLLELRTEELRLRELLEDVWRARTVAMAMLSALAREASRVEIADARETVRKAKARKVKR